MSKAMGQIIYEESADKKFDPLSSETLQLEHRLREHGLSSGRAMGMKGLPPGTIEMRAGKNTVLAYSEGTGGDIVVLGAATAGSDVNKLIHSRRRGWRL